MHNFLRAIHHVLILSSCPVHFTFLLLFLTAHFKCWPSWAVSMFLTLAVCVMNSRLPLNLSRLVNRGTWIGGVVYNSQITMPKASILHYYFYHICISRLQNHTLSNVSTFHPQFIRSKDTQMTDERLQLKSQLFIDDLYNYFVLCTLLHLCRRKRAALNYLYNCSPNNKI